MEHMSMVNRRAFIKLSGAAVLCACAEALGLSACSIWRSEWDVPYAPEGSYGREGDKVIVSLSATNLLREVGAAVRLRLGHDKDSEQRIIVVRSNVDAYRAFVDHCTHNGKELYYLHEENVLRCYSGRSYFDLEGQVIKGPAEIALHPFQTHRAEDELVIEIGSI